MTGKPGCLLDLSLFENPLKHVKVHPTNFKMVFLDTPKGLTSHVPQHQPLHPVSATFRLGDVLVCHKCNGLPGTEQNGQKNLTSHKKIFLRLSQKHDRTVAPKKKRFCPCVTETKGGALALRSSAALR